MPATFCCNNFFTVKWFLIIELRIRSVKFLTPRRDYTKFEVITISIFITKADFTSFLGPQCSMKPDGHVKYQVNYVFFGTKVSKTLSLEYSPIRRTYLYQDKLSAVLLQTLPISWLQKCRISNLGGKLFKIDNKWANIVGGECNKFCDIEKWHVTFTGCLFFYVSYNRVQTYMLLRNGLEMGCQTCFFNL